MIPHKKDGHAHLISELVDGNGTLVTIHGFWSSPATWGGSTRSGMQTSNCAVCGSTDSVIRPQEALLPFW